MGGESTPVVASSICVSGKGSSGADDEADSIRSLLTYAEGSVEKWRVEVEGTLDSVGCVVRLGERRAARSIRSRLRSLSSAASALAFYTHIYV